MSRRAVLKPIYGMIPCTGSIITEETIITNPLVPGVNQNSLQTLLANYTDLIDITAKLIKQFFPSVTIGSGIVADMSAKAYMSPSLFVRYEWMERNKGAKFDSTSKLHLTQLKSIYYDFDMNWTKDPVLKTVDWDA